VTLPASAAALAQVARRLGELKDEVVFVGGSVVPLLVPAAVAPTVRPTDDVDCVVRAATTVAYYRIEERLRAQGFLECRDEGAPTCRWVVDGVRVDVMPSGESALGFHNRWYDQVLADPLEIAVAPDLRVHIASPIAFLATKFDAFADRGEGDYMGNADFEDIVTVMAYRDDVADRILQADPELRRYLVACMWELLELRNLSDLVSGCLPPDAVSQSAVPGVLALMRDLAAAGE